MTQDEIIGLAKSINEDWWLDDIDLETFAKLIAEKEYEKTSAWYRKLITDIVSDIHKNYEKKPFRARTIKLRG
jgi:hypothetical protein